MTFPAAHILTLLTTSLAEGLLQELAAKQLSVTSCSSCHPGHFWDQAQSAFWEICLWYSLQLESAAVLRDWAAQGRLWFGEVTQTFSEFIAKALERRNKVLNFPWWNLESCGRYSSETMISLDPAFSSKHFIKTKQMHLAERSLFNDWKGCGKEIHVYGLVVF